MAFKIDRHPVKGYTISVGVGKLFRARDLQEVAYALLHYFGVQGASYGASLDHFSHKTDTMGYCPLCK